MSCFSLTLSHIAPLLLHNFPKILVSRSASVISLAAVMRVSLVSNRLGLVSNEQDMFLRFIVLIIIKSVPMSDVTGSGE